MTCMLTFNGPIFTDVVLCLANSFVRRFPSVLDTFVANVGHPSTRVFAHTTLVAKVFVNQPLSPKVKPD